MLVKVANKDKAFRAVINTWLKDRSRYCNQCGTRVEDMTNGICCDDQLIGTNWDFCKAIIEQNKDIRESRINDFGSNEKKNLRFGVSIPASLYYSLNEFKKMHNLPALFNEKGEMEWFAKEFPVFRTCKRV